MATSNKGHIPLPQLKAVIEEMKKQRFALDDLNNQLRSKNTQSAEIWRDQKGDEFRNSVQQIVNLDNKVITVLDGQIRVLSQYYDRLVANEARAGKNLGASKM